jgi:glycosyltransferase involved in cell wall biosynthesis
VNISPVMKRRLRVVHLVPGLAIGGLEKLLVEFAHHADRERFALRFVALDGRGVLAKEIESYGWPVTALDVPDGLHPCLFLCLARLLGRWRADVIHTHDERAHVYGTLAGVLARVPQIIHTQHGRKPLSRRQSWLLRITSQFLDRFVGVSDDVGRWAVQQRVPTRVIRTIRNGIDLERFPFTGPCNDGPAVLVARLSPEKDVETLLRAARLVVRETPDFRLEIAGDGPCLPALHQSAAAHGLAGCVRFLGSVREIPALLGRASLFVLSSLTEGVSLTLLEAMASGLPVIATRVGGNPEVVADGETGLLVPPGDPRALAAAVFRLRRDWGQAAQLGRAGRRRVEACFDVRRMVAEYEKMYLGVSAVNFRKIGIGNSAVAARTHPHLHYPRLNHADRLIQPSGT